MIYEREFKNVIWLDVLNPTLDEVKFLMREYKLHQDVADEILIPSLKPRLEKYPKYFFGILHFPAIKQSHTRGRAQEVDFILSDKYLITVRYDTNESIEKFARSLEVDRITHKVDIAYPSLFMFFSLFNTLYASSIYELDNADSLLRSIEDKVFLGQEKDMVFELSRFGRDMLEFKHIIEPHKETLKSLSKEWHHIFSDKNKNHTDRLISNYFKLKNKHKSLLDAMQEIRLTNDSLLSTKQNETMKVFTILAFVTFPLTLISSLFSMKTEYTPLVGYPFDFWIIVIAMAILTLILFMYFKSKKWL